MSFRFTTEYPLKPPTVRVLYPRFAPRSTGGVVSTGGTVQLALFTYQEWSPSAWSPLCAPLLRLMMSKCACIG